MGNTGSAASRAASRSAAEASCSLANAVALPGAKRGSYINPSLVEGGFGGFTFFMRKNDSSKIWVILLHGNAQVAVEMPTNWLFVNVIVPEYPGYDGDEKPRTAQGALDSAEAALYYLVHIKGVDPDNISVVGYSLGTGVARQLVEKHHLKKMVLLAPFLSIAQVVVPFGLGPLDIFHENSKEIPVDTKILIVHGKDDRVVPFSHGEKLAEKLLATGHTVKTHWLDGCDHWLDDIIVEIVYENDDASSGIDVASFIGDFLFS